MNLNDFFRDIFDYHHFYNQKITDQLIENKDKISERSIPLFSHMINAHHIWNARILGEKELIGVHQIHTLEKCMSLDQENYQTTLKILDEYDLGEQINYQNSKGYKFLNTIQQVLFHVANHTTHHRGQIISDLKQNRVEPMMTDYIFYKR